MAKRKPYNKSTGRDYTYDTEYQSSPEQIKNRSNRNKARRKLEKEGKVRKGDGKDVDHKDGNPKNNSRGNLQAISKKKNRAKH